MRPGGAHCSRLWALVAVLILFFPAALPAGAAAEMLEEVVSGSVIYDREEDKYVSPGMVTVIRPAEDRAGEQLTLPELLQDVPGLRVIALRGRYGYVFASVRGSTSAQVAVYVDGMLMNLQGESAVDLSRIPMGSVERVEVYRGYIPARFGAQGMGGIINIVTQTSEKPETRLSLEAGSFGRLAATASHSAPAGRGKFFTSLGYETYGGDFTYWNDNGTPYNLTDDYDGKRRNNGFDNVDTLLKWENGYWKARASWVRRNRELAIAGPGTDNFGLSQPPGPTQDTERWDLSLARTQRNGAVDWIWGLSYTGQERIYDSRTSTGTDPIGYAYTRRVKYGSDRIGLSLSASLSAGERHFLELLAEYSNESLRISGDRFVADVLAGDSHFRREDWNVNFQDTVALNRAGTFLATPSVRWHMLDGDSHFTWQIALTKEFSPRWMLKGTYGAYARAPNLFERHGDGAFIMPSSGGLKWETGVQFDLGLMWNGSIRPLDSAKARASLSAFWRNVENLIEFQVMSHRVGRYENISDAEVNGVELEGALDWEKWSLSGSATWLRGINTTRNVPDSGTAYYDGKRLPNRPEWSGALRLMRKFSRGSAFLEYQYVGRNFADAQETVLFDRRDLWNLGLKYDLSSTTQLMAGVNDVFNSADGWRLRSNGYNGPERVLWYPVEGRRFYVTFNLVL
jgi:outer membrane cobalamin receptor